jgi:hypothetical protein
MLSEKQTKSKNTIDVAQVVEHLPSKCKVSPKKKNVFKNNA